MLVLCNSIGTPLDPKYIDIGKHLVVVLLFGLLIIVGNQLSQIFSFIISVHQFDALLSHVGIFRNKNAWGIQYTNFAVVVGGKKDKW